MRFAISGGPLGGCAGLGLGAGADDELLGEAEVDDGEGAVQELLAGLEFLQAGEGGGFLAFGEEDVAAGGEAEVPAALADADGGDGAGAELGVLGEEVEEGGGGRLEFLATAWDAIRENPIFGAGYGAFVQTYQIYEQSTSINAEYVNHLHNDYGELLIEGGAVAGAMIVIYFLFLFSAAIPRVLSPTPRMPPSDCDGVLAWTNSNSGMSLIVGSI